MVLACKMKLVDCIYCNLLFSSYLRPAAATLPYGRRNQGTLTHARIPKGILLKKKILNFFVNFKCLQTTTLPWPRTSFLTTREQRHCCLLIGYSNYRARICQLDINSSLSCLALYSTYANTYKRINSLSTYKNNTL